MKSIFKVLPLLAVLGLGVATAGCAGSLQSTLNTLSSPAATQAANNVKTTVDAFACGLSQAASVAEGIEGQTYAGAPLVDAKGQAITNVVYASSTAACQLLGGAPLSTVATPVAASAVVQ